MRIFGSLTDCECARVPTEKPSEGGPVTAAKDPAIDQCCGGATNECCVEIAKKPEKGG